MKFDNMIDVLGGVVIVALATTVVTSRNTAGQISAAANGFSGLIRSALGAGSIRR